MIFHNWLSIINPNSRCIKTDFCGGAKFLPFMTWVKFPPYMTWRDKRWEGGFCLFAQPATCGSSQATFVDLLKRHLESVVSNVTCRFGEDHSHHLWIFFWGDIWVKTFGGSESTVSNVTRRFAEHHSHHDDDDDGCVYQFEIMIEKSVWIKNFKGLIWE